MSKHTFSYLLRTKFSSFLSLVFQFYQNDYFFVLFFSRYWNLYSQKKRSFLIPIRNLIKAILTQNVKLLVFYFKFFFHFIFIKRKFNSVTKRKKKIIFVVFLPLTNNSIKNGTFPSHQILFSLSSIFFSDETKQ